MKKLSLFLFYFLLLILPFSVFAESCDSNITVDSVKAITSKGYASENSKASIQNQNIILNPNMNFIKDSITYKIVLKNSSKHDLEISKNLINSNSKYVSYSIDYDGDTYIKANSTKDIYVNVYYQEEVPSNLFLEDRYKDKHEIDLLLSSPNNPLTGHRIFLLVFIIVLSFIIGILLTLYKKSSSFTMILLLLFLFPVVTYASCIIHVNIKILVDFEKITEFDTGKAVNYKMDYLSGYIRDIQFFKRSNSLPDSIKTIVDNQLLEMENVSVTDDEVANEISNLYTYNLTMYDFSIKEEDNQKYYCYDHENYCYSRDTMMNWLEDSYVFPVEVESNHYNYLLYDHEKEDFLILEEEDFKKVFKEKLLLDKKKDSLKNVFSSPQSQYLIYGWYDENEQGIYYYSKKNDLYLNQNSSHFFEYTNNISDISGINSVNASKAVKLNSMFSEAGFQSDAFHMDISQWNTSKAQDMSSMFDNCGQGESWSIGDISQWDTSNVVDMSAMFHSAGSRVSQIDIGDLGQWDTSNVKTMFSMFSYFGFYSTDWNIGDISRWDTSNVEDMSYMFSCAGYQATTWNVGNIGLWNTSNVKKMGGMFSGAAEKSQSWNVGNIGLWDTSNVTIMSEMFLAAASNADHISLDLSQWNTSSVTRMSYMFKSFGYQAGDVSLDLNHWDMSNVQTVQDMFFNMAYNTDSLVLNISNWNIVANELNGFVYNMGYNAREIDINMSNMTLQNVTHINGSLLSNYGRNSDILYVAMSNFRAPNLEDVYQAFAGFGYHATDFSLDVSNWYIPKVSSLRGVFTDAGKNATTWSLGDLSTWDTSNVTNMSYLFYGAGANTSSKWFVGDLSQWNTSKVEDMSGMFSRTGNNATSWSIGDLSGWDTRNVMDMTHMFSSIGNANTVFESIGTLNIYADDIAHMFYNNAIIKATLNLYSDPTDYIDVFRDAATSPDSSIVVNYSSQSTSIDHFLPTYYSNPHIVRGIVLDS